MRYADFADMLPKSKVYAKYTVGVCPFHDDNDPSIMVFPDGWFNCLGCNRSGTWKTLWNKLKGQNVIIRPENNNSWVGPRIEDDLESHSYQAHLDLMKYSSFQWYLSEMRGLERRIEINELGYSDGWYTVPVFDEEGRFITSVFRSSPLVQNVTGLRYVCKHVPVPYIPDRTLFDSSDYVFVVYGIFDALTLADLRYPVVTSTSGKDTVNHEWFDKIRKKIIIIPDKGEEHSAYDLARRLDFRGHVALLDYPNGIKDCNGFYEKKKGEELRLQLENAK